MIGNHLTDNLTQQQRNGLFSALDRHAALLLVAADGRILHANEKFCRAASQPLHALVGIPFSQLFPACDSEAIQTCWTNLQAGETWQGELRLKTPGGDTGWLEATLTPVSNAEEQFDGVSVVCHDISACKHQATWLQEAQELGQIGHWNLNLLEGNLEWSAQTYRLFELDPAEFKASYAAFLDRVHPEDRELVNHAYSNSVMQHSLYDIEHRLHFPNGRIKWVRERGWTEYDDDGMATKSMGIIQDITARKEAEEQSRIASIAFETQEAIVITDANARIISVNGAFERLTGYSREEAIGQNPNILQSGRHDERFYEDMWHSLNSKGNWSGEMWDKRKDGVIYPKWLNITAVRGETGDVSHYVAIFMDISERKNAEEEIHRLAFYDTLTELPNRRLLIERLNQSVANSHRSGTFSALMFMDLDNFKTLNDTQGHDIGDMLLIEVAQRLRLCVRESDTVARLGGDEFVVILQNLGSSELIAANQTEHLAEKIIDTLNAPYFLNRYEHHSTASIGICMFQSRDIAVEELLKRADTAMYQAKSSGRNAVRFFETKMQTAIESRVILEKQLRYALSRQELTLYFQVQANATRQVTGAEVLLRWFNPDQGFVSPNQFIPLAEETGLILAIGSWVLETACEQLQEWNRRPFLGELQISVNVSARQFRQPDFAEQVKQSLRRYGFNPTRLKLELTESLVLVDIDDTIKKMNAIKELGVQFSMDDFGTGYSSLSYLKRLPLDQIKIDQSFVRDIVVDKNDEVIVRTIIDMSRNFGFEVIAEGVETNEQADILNRNGCYNYQGYLFGKPMPVKEFEQLLQETRTKRISMSSR